MNNLKVATIPLDIVWTDIDENLFAVGRSLTALDKDTDIVVLPELFSTGFITGEDLLHRFAEDADNSPTLHQISLWAKKFNFAIAGTVLIREDNKFYNRAFFIEPSGDKTFYDKTHLFSISTESKQFTPGNESIPIVRFRGWNIAMAICYELRFPCWLRNNPNHTYDLLLVPANWPNKRAYAWEHLLIARAIENQAFVVGVNRSGCDDGGQYSDTTYILNYLGKHIASPINTLHGAMGAVLDGERMLQHRRHFPFLKDADNFYIHKD